MEELAFKENKIEKPKHLYYGSAEKNITIFKPTPNEFMGAEKDFFFASPDRNAAIAYMYSGRPWSSRVDNDTGIISSIFPITREEFIGQDKGGAVYVFSPEKFTSHPKRKHYEWVTEESIKPESVEVFASGLKAMEDAGIKMYFLGSLERYNEFAKLQGGREQLDFLKKIDSY